MESTSDMPAVNKTGNTRIDRMGNPLDASAAEMLSNPISVAGPEAKPKQEAEREHVPTFGNQPKHGTEKAGEQAMIGKQHIEIG